MPIAKIFVDGACVNNGRPDAAMGIGVYWYEPMQERYNLCEPYKSYNKATNQKAEIEAARRGIVQCMELGYFDVTVYTDSRYVIGAINEWLPSWEKNGFISSTGSRVVNEQDFKRLADAIRQLKRSANNAKLEFRHVESSENYADPLAKRAAQIAFNEQFRQENRR